MAALPELPGPRPAPGRPAPWPVDPPPEAPFTAEGLRALAADATERAWHLTRGDGGSGLDLDAAADVARRAATALGTDAWQVLAARSGQRRAELARRAIAWRHGGEAGLRALDEAPWRPPVVTMAPAREAAVAAGLGGRSLQLTGNRLVLSPTEQLRLGRNRRWSRFEKRGGRWELSDPPADEAEELLEAE